MQLLSFLNITTDLLARSSPKPEPSSVVSTRRPEENSGMDAGELKRRFGRQVQGLREARGLTQEQLADRIGRSVDTVGNIERGVNATRIEVAYQIASELGVRLPDLFTFGGSPSSTGMAESPAAAALRELVAGCDNDTAAKLLELVRTGLALANRV